MFQIELFRATRKVRTTKSPWCPEQGGSPGPSSIPSPSSGFCLAQNLLLAQQTLSRLKLQLIPSSAFKEQLPHCPTADEKGRRFKEQNIIQLSGIAGQAGKSPEPQHSSWRAKAARLRPVPRTHLTVQLPW